MYRKLRGRIVEKYGTLRAFAVALGTSSQIVSRHLSGKSCFTAERMDKWGGLLDITRSEYGEYFFA